MELVENGVNRKWSEQKNGVNRKWSKQKMKLIENEVSRNMK